ncbi:Serine/threonine kinase [Rhizoclosmatium sp. JEL0117]|nr:Serine/threonine kinase [Rhizoclosmatium sp. JEL0117]
MVIYTLTCTLVFYGAVYPLYGAFFIQSKISSIQQKIDIEHKTQQGAKALLPNLTDEVLKEQCEHAIKESEKRLQYLETELHKLQVRKNLVTGDERSLLKSTIKSPKNTLGRSGRRLSDPVLQETGGAGDLLTTAEEGPSRREIEIADLRAKPTAAKDGSPIIPDASISAVPVPSENGKPVLSDFDYLKSETAITSQRVKYKLAEVESKLDIEHKVQAGTERMYQVMKLQPQTPGDLRYKQIEEKLLECQTKVQLLTKSRQRYKGLDLEDAAVIVTPDTTNDSPIQYKINKRPQSGKLHLKILAANALPNKKYSRSETYVVIKIDGVHKAQTKMSITGKWFEDFEVAVEKALEVEVCVYERGGGILGLVWFKIAELETMQRLTAMNSVFQRSNPSLESPSVGSGGDKTENEVGEHWLDLEPGGQIAIKLNFVAAAGKLQRRHKTIVRNAPVQKVFPKKGHKFAPTSFYQVMKCAVCCEFLVSSQGYQCQACKYTCHKKCQERVFSKCITLGEKENGDGGEDQLMHHRIPHRFEDTYNLGVNWCCHCGYMLPLSKKECKRCSECGISAHNQCSLLVPSLCGLTTELIDQMKRAIDQAEKLKKEKEIMKAEKAKAKEAADKEEKKAALAVEAKNDTSKNDRDKLTPGGLALPVDVNGSRRPSHVETVPATTKGGAAVRVAPRGIGLDDFNLLAVLGKGNFGKVMLAEEKLTKKHYAIKVLKKDFVIENDESESTRSEKRVFLAANLERFPFLVNLHSCFQTETRLYFVMEFVSGGDLMWHIQHERFSEKRARYYACEVLLALEYFHKNNITYRDLKLDNILLTLEGHIKIADYGLCKENMPYGATTATFCGTPEFMAPEILKEKPYTRAVDWWALGVLIYEMILGQSPFPGDGEDQIFDAILHDDVLFPGNMNKDAVDILKKLLTKDPTMRLGSTPRDSEDIKSHPYFKDVNWSDVLNLRIPPPFFPKITSPTDTSNFDEEFTKEAPVLTPINMILSATDQEEFRGFTHIR